MLSLTKDRIRDRNYEIFFEAAASGDLDLMQQIFGILPNEVPNLIQMREYGAFRRAAKYGHLHIINKLIELAPGSVPKMIRSNQYEAFCEATANGHIHVMDKLILLVQKEERLNMVSACGYQSICGAAKNRHFDAMVKFIELSSSNLADIIKSYGGEMFKHAAMNADNEFMDKLIALAPNEILFMNRCDDYAAFRAAAKNRHIHIVKKLANLFPSEITNMIAANQYEAFYVAVINSNIKLMDTLIELAPVKVRDMVESCGSYAFQSVEIMDKLISLAPTSVYKLLCVWKYGAFHAELDKFQYDKTRSYVLIDKLIQLAANEAPLMIESQNYRALRKAVIWEKPELINRFLSFADCFAYAEKNNWEYDHLNNLTFSNIKFRDQYIAPFTQNKLGALRVAKVKVEQEVLDKRFDVEDAQEAKLCFYMLRNLIRRNELACFDDICFLLDIPAVQALIVDQGYKELLQEALTVSNENAVVLLFKGQKVINLSYLSIKKHLVEALSLMCPLKTALNMSNNLLGFQPIADLAKLFQAIPPTVTWLDLRNNNFHYMKCENAESLNKLLPQIKTIYLSHREFELMTVSGRNGLISAFPNVECPVFFDYKGDVLGTRVIGGKKILGSLTASMQYAREIGFQNLPKPPSLQAHAAFFAKHYDLDIRSIPTQLQNIVKQF